MERCERDLISLPEPLRRSHWCRSLATSFAGIQVTDLPAAAIFGRVRATNLLSAGLWEIESVPQSITRPGAGIADATSEAFKVLIQMTGEASVRQAKRHALLKPGMVTLIDGRQPFFLEMHAAYRQILIQLPRSTVLARYPGMQNRTAIVGESGHAGVGLLRHFAASVVGTRTAFTYSTKLHACAALIELLGGAGFVSCHRTAALLERALTLIAIHGTDCDFTPEQLAMQLHVSRRYLDRICTEYGQSASVRIWEHRLRRAAHALSDPNAQTQTITGIGYATGFRDPVHFARLFRKHFGMAPRMWRKQQLSIS
ncbi:MAG: helix-turn-helix domain-containing protein [Acidiferrobacteraceae bacterium]